jgi:phage terminase large subunit
MIRPNIDIRIPDKMFGLFMGQARYRVAYGGRGGGKTNNFARVAIGQALSSKQLFLCTRQFQKNIRDSVHQTICDEAEELGLHNFFTIKRDYIVSKTTRSKFIFSGLAYNISQIKSTKGITRAWLEEANQTTEDAFMALDPTVRTDNSEIWLSYNPDSENDYVHKRFVKNTDPDAKVVKINWNDNIFFPDILNKIRLNQLERDKGQYDWIWEGECRQIKENVIFKDRIEIREFDTPHDAKLYFGADFGFAVDPNVLIRCFIEDDTLYIDEEAWGYGTTIEALPALYDRIHGSRRHAIYADNSRPETIDYIKRHGFHILSCSKWSGSVEDGIERLKGFRKIVIHSRCKEMARESRLYSWKIDRAGAILPQPASGNDHGWDAVRYALNDVIKKKSGNMVDLLMSGNADEFLAKFL